MVKNATKHANTTPNTQTIGPGVFRERRSTDAHIVLDGSLFDGEPFIILDQAPAAGPVEVYRLEQIRAQEPPGGARAALRGWRKITQSGPLLLRQREPVVNTRKK